ncbi:ATP-binding protein [Dyadobacter frigoris]|uniref:AAA+ ATPase domain-containing protein n=1 Tax=Dyadobacter frigoris TaxID=2576211 RepID=A0A4V6BHH1_9BACT|nr:ATP-binding protein [Dyadobacter frigoris]TKT86283.1 hypothetical protein FDK13_32750 [Dyadobacter frigoris]GLU56874.1 hypothetical protein Dfri01_63350 [Dyadobacter frigoris]
MIKGNLSENIFSYKDSHRFNDNNYILVVKDEEFPDKNVLSILYNNNGTIWDIDDYDMGDKIFATWNRNIEELPLGERFSLNQLVKISHGHIIGNEKYYENSPYPKSLTFHTNIHSLGENEIIEIFEGKIEEGKARFEIREPSLGVLITDIYLQTNNCFFINDSDKIIGPFKALKKDSSGQFVIEKSFWKPFGEYEYNESMFIQFSANDIERKIIIPSLNKLKLLKSLEFISDDHLIDNFRINFSNNPDGFNVDILEKAFEFIQKAINLNSINENDRTNKRLLELLRVSERAVLSDLNISQILPEVKQTKRDIQELQELKLSLQTDINNYENKISNLTQEILLNEEQQASLTIELENITKIREEKLLNKGSELDLRIKELEERREKLDKEIEEEKKNKSEDINELDATIDYKRKVEKELDSAIKTLKDSFVTVQKDSYIQLNELIKHKTHFDFISGKDISTYDPRKKDVYKSYQINAENHEDYKTFRKKILDIFESNNRKLESHFIDNLLISIHQNTLTLFAGLPGTGKTSLVRILLNVLAPKERIREVAVARGWTSQRDLIGFHNPLSKGFHASSTGIYSLLKQLDWETENQLSLSSPLGYILLDEANLSPLEHYWSTFYNLTDSYASKESVLKINIGENETISYPNNLRFIGTINYDQTTEELSSRVLNRANIIRMNPRALDIDSLSINEISNLNFSFKQAIDFFELIDFSTEQKAISMDLDSENKYKEIKRNFEGLKIYISPRVEIGIKRYFGIAKKLMYEENRPLDYCIAQRLLPLINVQGENARKKLNDLLSLLKSNKFDISSRILEEIIQAGGEGEIYEDNYNYFLTLSHV